MEPRATSKRLISLGLIATLTTAAAGFFGYQYLTRSSLASVLKADLPILNLTVKLLDINQQPLDAADSIIGSNDQQTINSNEQCSLLVGGDSAERSFASSDVTRPAECPNQAVWYVKTHPIALTLAFNQGQQFLTWWDQSAKVKNLVENRFIQGLFFGFAQSLKIKAEQLKLDGIQGEFLAHLLRDAIAANAQLHYDMVHAERGWVLTYQRSRSDFIEQALPAMMGLLATNAYKVNKLPEPIVQVRVGLQQIYMTEYQQRIYLAQSLEALLNVLESLKPTPTDSDAPLSLIVCAEAFVDNLVPVLAGQPSWNPRIDFALNDQQLGVINLPSGPWQLPLHDKIFEGVLASIPHDAFAALATSFQISPTLAVEDWQHFANQGPKAISNQAEPAGLALIWDFEKTSPTGAIGIVIANPTNPKASAAYQQYVKNSGYSAECAGGSLFLIASSQSLLSRIKDACAHQSLSPLDWQKGSEKSRFLASQLMAFVNPGVAMQELFMAGGAIDSADDSLERNQKQIPHWQNDYLKAKDNMRKQANSLFNDLPIFSYAGRADANPVRLEGRAIQQELSQ